MATNRYIFQTELEGFVNVFEDSGKYNNRCFGYTIPDDVVAKMEEDREELLDWVRTKSNGRVSEALPPWDEKNLAKYSYGEGDGSSKPKPEPVFIDTDNEPIDRAVLKDMRKTTRVELVVQQKPYTFGKTIGTSLRVLVVQVLELATGNGAIDSGVISLEDAAAMVSKKKGYKQSEPAPQDGRTDSEGYDF